MSNCKHKYKLVKMTTKVAGGGTVIVLVWKCTICGDILTE